MFSLKENCLLSHDYVTLPNRSIRIAYVRMGSNSHVNSAADDEDVQCE